MKSATQQKLNGSTTAGNIITMLLVAVLCLNIACNNKQEIKNPLFEVLDSKRTGIDFMNKLTYNKDFNLFKYIYFYNGSGVGAGDFNNDGKVDLFFGSNQGSNKLYLNTGDLHFKDVTKQAAIPDDGGWTTGISVVDINNDGLLDVYVCRVGQFETLHSKNLFLINQGIGKDSVPVFKDMAEELGLNFTGFSTQAAFFDYDLDGDLDMYLMNHSVHQNGTFMPRKDFIGTYHPLSGDKMYRNDDGKFTDVTKQTGINSSAIGYGLGVVVADINLDGYPDLYIANDFHEDDYLYINQKNGTFKETHEEQMMHTSQYSMGVDAADVNNDAFPEIISMDMLASDPYILKRSLGEDDYVNFNYKISIGYSYQYTRNNLQYNRKNGLFSEIGLYSGVAATDWSWAPLWMDFDNDGLKDLFISNGIPKRMNDIDYINFVSNSEIQQRINSNTMEGKNAALISKFPEIKIPNKFYHNKGSMSFDDEEAFVKGNAPTFSNGAAYADLDNDGDLDIVVNNIDDMAMVYENKNDERGKQNAVELKLKGSEKNENAIGAKLIGFAGNEIRTYEKYPVKGFISSMEVPLHVGMKNTKFDSVFLVWPDNSYQKINLDTTKTFQQVNYNKGLPQFNYGLLTTYHSNTTNAVIDVTAGSGLDFVDEENHFVEFDREPLIPHMLSTEGPAVAVADIDKNGLDDVFIGAPRNSKSVLYLQMAPGKFTKTAQPVIDADSSYEDVDACFADVNNDGSLDLVVASGGNEFYGNDIHNTPRVYLNDGSNHFNKDENAFSNLYLTASSVALYDFNGDGFVDLFIGARAVPWEYGQVPQSYLLQNNGHGKFVDVTKKYGEEISNAGFVTQASWVDMDKDGDKDLLLALEWGVPTVFKNEKGKFVKQELATQHGWWNVLTPVDIDNDGDLDLIAGNLGLNSRLQASKEKPVKLYYNDFDGNGKKEQVLTYFVGNKEIPFANKAELEKQMPVLKKKFLYAEDFAKASLSQLFGEDKLADAEKLTADYFSNAIFINNGNWKFDVKAMPFEAQFSCYKDAVVVNANNDNLPDILLMGNYYDNNIEMGRYDADFGTLLINKGNGDFTTSQLNGLSIKGQVRKIRVLKAGSKPLLLLGKNNDAAQLISF